MTRILFTALLALTLGAGQIGADGPKPFPEFSAKRIKPPSSGGAKRITVQIDPTVQPVVAASSAPAAPPVATPAGRYQWFWDKVSPEAASSGPGRLDVAMTALAAATRKVPAPRLQQMQEIAQANGIDILRSTIGTQVSPALVLAVITVESSGNSDAVSRAGAQGLMQLMPDTAARFGVADSLAASQNITGGVKYLNWLMEEFDRDPILVLAGYNAGEGSVRKHAGVPPFAETRDYVPKVLAAFQVAKGLCKTPPQLITDGCVFASMN
ncbi:lytic transglycosylase domain-containing protein [Sulfitobacter aestuariivivens]|uniref:Lytic transglycosylase domain-containing protein n=1 Tax=Sulfitobacter aestuariivivens TaxID=2766981 RepID=A0A927D5X5_9RHOB|nr:lytic transglycosylase domain-containing protein [Sulfitobacter aestuariivivens]MBD3663837.1 lytic transglycosylase domain-containing protein [Sulfitobacter aestuariivivens]